MIFSPKIKQNIHIPKKSIKISCQAEVHLGTRCLSPPAPGWASDPTPRCQGRPPAASGTGAPRCPRPPEAGRWWRCGHPSGEHRHRRSKHIVLKNVATPLLEKNMATKIQNMMNVVLFAWRLAKKRLEDSRWFVKTRICSKIWQEFSSGMVGRRSRETMKDGPTARMRGPSKFPLKKNENNPERGKKTSIKITIFPTKLWTNSVSIMFSHFKHVFQTSCWWDQSRWPRRSWRDGPAASALRLCRSPGAARWGPAGSRWSRPPNWGGPTGRPRALGWLRKCDMPKLFCLFNLHFFWTEKRCDHLCVFHIFP